MKKLTESLPRPIILPNVVQEDNSATMQTLSSLMPFHVSVIVVLTFITIITLQKVIKADDIVVPGVTTGSETAQLGPLGGVKNPGEGNPLLQAKQWKDRVGGDGWAERKTDITGKGEANNGGVGQGITKDGLSLIGLGGGGDVGGGGGELAPFGLLKGGDRIGPKSDFVGVTLGNAYHIVYCVDMSGSMLESFDVVKKELLRSISRLNPQQTFHVLFFSSANSVKENPTRRLVFATDSNKQEALDFLRTIQPTGGSPTVPDEAIKRAFNVLQGASDNKGKLIYLLTDGEFYDNAQVKSLIQDLNKGKSVRVSTLLYVYRSPEMEKWMDEVARENGGLYRYISRPNE